MLARMFDDLFEANRGYASRFELAGIPAPAAKKFGLVTCMDSRIEPLAMLGLGPGDAKIMRNAGGRDTTDVLRSLILATRFLAVRRIAVMQHTGCAMAALDDASIKSDLAEEGVADTDGWEFLTMEDPESALREDVDRVRSCQLLAPGVVVEGWRYDVETGLISQEVPS
jgi:carbonic anhydrase